MKKILITQRLIKEPIYNEIRTALDVRWSELLLKINLLPILVPNDLDIGLLSDLDIQGIILTGGNDLSRFSDDELSSMRDSHERRCIEYAINHSLPILGVCRGMQVIADYFGSSFCKVNNHVGVNHRLIVFNNSAYSSQLEKLEFVNSFHDYAIDKLGVDLKAVAIAGVEQVVEAIEHPEHKIFGQMWHPERDNPFEPLNLEFLSSFFENT